MNFRALIEKQETQERQPVATPEWPELDGKLFVRVLSAEERVRFADQATDNEGRPTPRYTAALVAMAACDDDGRAGFTENDIAWLAGRNGNAVKRIYDAAARLNEMDKSSREDLEKNSDAAPTSGST